MRVTVESYVHVTLCVCDGCVFVSGWSGVVSVPFCALSESTVRTMVGRAACVWLGRVFLYGPVFSGVGNSLLTTCLFDPSEEHQVLFQVVAQSASVVEQERHVGTGPQCVWSLPHGDYRPGCGWDKLDPLLCVCV